ncbi:MBG domain-containing protein, partial [Chitinophaga sp. Cy-1792]|uniref:MBG domain-containing protein n=1 Tax=Chitinophaga sp. Cy-1792 TaxID=2608339 RepID=UPI00141FA165
GNAQNATNAGTYTITPSGLTAANYTITYADGALTINPAAITVTANAATKTYNGLPYNGGNGVTIAGLVNNESNTVVTGTPVYSGDAQNATNVGTYTITPSGLTTANYTITYADGALTINPATLTVTANTASKTYNGLPYNGGNGVTIAGLVNNESNTVVTGTPVYSGDAQNATNAGTYTITPSGLTATNYTITYADGALTINPAAITVTAKADSKTYNGLPYNGGNGVTITGLVNNESNTVVTGTPVYSGNAQNATNAGTYTITPSGLTAANYTITYADGTLTINPAAITVTANAATKTYNGLPYIGGNGVTIAGLVNNESNTVVTGTPVYSGDAQNATNAGTYTITPSGLTAANYTITYADGTLTINPAAITVTANAATKTYNGLPYNGGNGVTIAGLVNNESNTVVTGTPVYTGDAQNATNVGSYTITPSGLTAANYTITYADGALTINPATLTVTANTASKTYNGLPYNGGNGVTIAGLVNNESNTVVTGTPVYSGDAQNATNAGTYTITPSGLTATNYTITYADGALTINPAAITVTANAASKTYNGLPYNGGNGVTITGLVNNESNTVVTGTPVYTGDAQNAVNVGSYTITPSGLTAANYTITYADGTLTINPAAITVTANAKSKTYDGLPYNGGNGVTIAGLVNNESNTVVTGTPVYSGNAQNATNAGTYTITPSGLTAANYTITYADGTLTINPAAITVTANAASKTYNGLPYNGGNGVTITGLVNNESKTVVTGTPVYTGDAQNATNVGSYTITPSGLTAANYTITYANGALTINPAAITVTANAASKTYNGLPYNGGNGITITGLVNNESSSVVTGTPAYTGNAQNAINVGGYTITPAGLTAANYTITYADGVLTINPAAIIVTANAATKTYDGLPYNGGNGVTISGLVNNESNSVVTGTPVYTGNAQNAVNVGGYTIMTAGLTAANYTITYAGGTLTINPATLTITANDQSYCVGNTAPALTVNYSGWVNAETTSALSQLPVVQNSATANSPAGTYNLTPSGAVASNYVMNYQKGILKINAAPVSTLTAPQGNTICGNGATLNLLASGAYTFKWQLNNNDIRNATNNSYVAATTGTYTAVATDANGCTAPADNSIIITQETAPVAAFTYNSYCVDKKIAFTNQSIVNNNSTVKYSWDNGAGATSTEVSPQFTYNTAGNYTVTLTVTPTGCPSLANTITEKIPVEAAIAGVELNPVTTDAGTPVNLPGRNFANATYSWAPSSGLSNPDVMNPVATLEQSTHLNITMTFPSGCTTTDYLQVNVNTGNAILVPNVFSPNNDGQNDILYPNLMGIKKLHYFKVFNRWGKLMFETNDEKKGWNGRVNGELQPLATYVWTAEGVDANGRIYHTQGTVTLLR